jgi:hypothetical protein
MATAVATRNVMKRSVAGSTRKMKGYPSFCKYHRTRTRIKKRQNVSTTTLSHASTYLKEFMMTATPCLEHSELAWAVSPRMFLDVGTRRRNYDLKLISTFYVLIDAYSTTMLLGVHQ